MIDKIKKLVEHFNGKKVLVAYSGGSDSSALLHILKSSPNIEVHAITIKGAHIPEKEFIRAIGFCEKFNINHKVLMVDILKVDGLERNDKNRCYYCKTKAFTLLKEEAEKLNADIVADGTNVDDKGDYRPGMKALKELDIFSPFLHFEIGKKEIFDYLKNQNLEEFIQPSNACLISRVAYGEKLSEELLIKIDTGEEFLRKLGFVQVRARVHKDLVRIEVKKEKFSDFFPLSEKINEKFKKLGFKFVTFDLEGYRTGSMNEVILATDETRIKHR